MLLNCVLEKTLESPLDWKEIQPVHPKGNQSWIFIGRTDAEAETPILWPPDVKNWLIWKDLDAGKVWRWEEKGMTEDKMVGWQHQLKGHEFEQAPWVGDGQGGLACCSPWSCKELDVAEQLNWTELIMVSVSVIHSFYFSLKKNLWSIVDLQCVSFRCRAKWFSCVCVCVYIYIFFFIMVYYSIYWVYWGLYWVYPCAIQ